MTDCQIADSLRDRLETHYENAPEDAQPFTLSQIKNAGWGVFGLLIAEVLNGVELEQVRIALKDITYEEYQYIKNNLSPIRCRTHPNAFKRLALREPEPEKQRVFFVVRKRDQSLLAVHATRRRHDLIEWNISSRHPSDWTPASDYIRIASISSTANNLLLRAEENNKQGMRKAIYNGMEI